VLESLEAPTLFGRCVMAAKKKAKKKAPAKKATKKKAKKK
jgi:hypothetical protein